MEVIVAGYMEYDALLPALIAAYTASMTSHMLGLEKFAVNITENWNISGRQRCFNLDYSWSSFWSYRKILFCSFTESQEIVRRKDFQSLYPNRYPGSSACNPPFCNPQRTLYRTAEPDLISASFAGETIYGYDWILKLLFTIFTLAIGFQGGEVTPLFSIGASLGIILGLLLGIPPVICAALGYAAVFGSATNTLFAPILIGLEVFGSQNIIPLVLVCIIAYLVNGNRSIYGAQQKALCRFEE